MLMTHKSDHMLVIIRHLYEPHSIDLARDFCFEYGVPSCTKTLHVPRLLPASVWSFAWLKALTPMTLMKGGYCKVNRGL